jgi:hypothetical protein
MTWLSYVILGLAAITIALIIAWPRLRYRAARAKAYRLRRSAE